MDQRLSAALLGGGLGVVLVAVVRPPSGRRPADQPRSVVPVVLAEPGRRSR